MTLATILHSRNLIPGLSVSGLKPSIQFFAIVATYFLLLATMVSSPYQDAFAQVPEIKIGANGPDTAEEKIGESRTDTMLTFQITASTDVPSGGLKIGIEVMGGLGNYLTTSEIPTEINIPFGQKATSFTLNRRAANTMVDPNGRISVRLKEDYRTPPRYTLNQFKSVASFIFHDSSLPTSPFGVAVTANTATITEGQLASFQITANNPRAIPITNLIKLNVTGGSNFFPSEYSFPTQAEFVGSNLFVDLNFQTENDLVMDASQDLTVTIMPSDDYDILTGHNTASITITDNETTQSITITAVKDSVFEDEDAVFRISPSDTDTFSKDLSVLLEITAKSNFYASRPTLSVAVTSGDMHQDHAVAISDDTVDEADQTITAEIVTNPNSDYHITASSNSASVMVKDNDVPLLSIEAESNDVPEGMLVRFNLTSSIVPHQQLTVNFCIRDGVNVVGANCGSASLGIGNVIQKNFVQNRIGSVTFGGYGSISTVIEVPTIADNLITTPGRINLTIQYTDSTTNKSAAYSVASSADATATTNVTDTGLPTVNLLTGDTTVTAGNPIHLTMTSTAASSPVVIILQIEESGDFLVDYTGTHTYIDTIGEPIDSFSRPYSKLLTLNTLANPEFVGTPSESDVHVVVTIQNYSTQYARTNASGYQIGSKNRVEIRIVENQSNIPNISIVAVADTVNTTNPVKFKIMADKSSNKDITIKIAFTQTHNLVLFRFPELVLLHNGRKEVPLTIATGHLDSPEFVSGTITARIRDGGTNSDYVPSSSRPIQASVTVNRTRPSIWITAEERSISAGNPAIFKINADPVLPTDTPIKVAVIQTHNFIVFRAPHIVSINRFRPRATLTLFTKLVDEPEFESGTITVKIVEDGPNPKYRLSTTEEIEVTVTVTDITATPSAQNYSVAAHVLNAILMNPGRNSPYSIHPNELEPSTFSLPEISIVAVKPVVAEGESARFIIDSIGVINDPLPVNISIQQFNVDIEHPEPDRVNFDANNMTAEVVVPTLNDEIASKDGRVTATVLPGAGYVVNHSTGQVSVTISDADDRNKRGTLIETAGLAAFSEQLGTSVATTLNAASGRLNLMQQHSQQNEFMVGGYSTMTEILQTGGAALNKGAVGLHELLGNSFYSFGLFPDGNTSSFVRLWGSGHLREVESNNHANSIGHTGEILTGHFGLEGELGEGVLIGQTTTISESQFEHGQETTDRLYFDTQTIGMYPNIGFSSPQGDLQIQMVAGYGESETMLEQEHYAPESIGSHHFMVGLSGKKQLQWDTESLREDQTQYFVTGNMWVARQHSDRLLGLTQVLRTDVGHAHLTFETVQSRETTDFEQQEIQYAIGLRGDGKTGNSFVGTELSSQFNLASANGMKLTGQGMVMLPEFAEIGLVELGTGLDFDSNSDGLGIVLTNNVSLVRNGNLPVTTLWPDNLLNTDTLFTQQTEDTGFSAEIGYGISVYDVLGRITPFGGYEYLESDGRKVRIGSKISIDTNFDMEATGTRNSSNTTGVDHEWRLNGNLNW